MAVVGLPPKTHRGQALNSNPRSPHPCPRGVGFFLLLLSPGKRARGCAPLFFPVFFFSPFYFLFSFFFFFPPPSLTPSLKFFSHPPAISGPCTPRRTARISASPYL